MHAKALEEIYQVYTTLSFSNHQLSSDVFSVLRMIVFLKPSSSISPCLSLPRFTENIINCFRGDYARSMSTILSDSGPKVTISESNLTSHNLTASGKLSICAMKRRRRKEASCSFRKSSLYAWIPTLLNCFAHYSAGWLSTTSKVRQTCSSAPLPSENKHVTKMGPISSSAS